jgi:hypothetical protein
MLFFFRDVICLVFVDNLLTVFSRFKTIRSMFLVVIIIA